MAKEIYGIIEKAEEVTEYGKTHQKLTFTNGDVYKVKVGQGGNLKNKWHLLYENFGAGIKLLMEDYKNPKGEIFPFVADFETPVEIPQEKKAEAVKSKPTEVEFAPQEQGMWYKEVGELYRAGLLKDSVEAKAIMTAYWIRMFTVLGIKKEH